MILDLGSDKRFTKISKKLVLRDMILLPICIGCEHHIEEGKEYITNDSGSLSHHTNGFCKELAEKYQVSFYSKL